ncbi:transporter substrate-binding protein [Salinicola aestuarinus]|uniref:transporter substrate-binding protein n=1 Tax=Salinicola aestuarinus TaxID=1949082 RepID=UPI000DA2150B|nr:transporter substrate-binding protein [Salinicola aestuarinus]
MTLELPIGVLYSTSGTYQRISRHARQGALRAVEEVNRQPGGVRLVVHEADPRGQLEAYHDGVESLLRRGVRHVVGTTTSASRKDIVPDLERAGALLWYASPYEGFECSESVVYLGGSPNQNLVPLLEYVLRAYGKRGVLIGSNYVWGWESNRIARELIDAAAGEVIGEKYYHFGDSDFATLIEQILASDSDFVLNNLLGESSYFFLEQLNTACARVGRRLPVLSCNFTECELPAISHLSHLRLLSSGPWFDVPGNAFSAQQRVRGDGQRFSSCYTCAYTAVMLLARACEAIGDDDPEAVLTWLQRGPQETPLGRLALQSHNNHLTLPNYIAEAQAGRFEVVYRQPNAIEADPYLTGTSMVRFHDLAAPAPVVPDLKVVK